MTLSYKKILVAVDGSHEAELALKKAIEIAKRNDAALVLAHVIDIQNFIALEVYDTTIRDRSKDYAEELLTKYIEMTTAAQLQKVTTIIDYGSPKVKIPKDIAKKQLVDLIVCGATGLNTLERFLLGSVSENIVRNAPCDVLIVRNEEKEA